jgi:hypothetical protein
LFLPPPWWGRVGVGGEPWREKAKKGELGELLPLFNQGKMHPH